jgi:putative ABC transport system ATP-binding protein
VSENRFGPLIRLEAISKSHLVGTTQVAALVDVDVQIGLGEFVAIEGPSGCGKSTLLSIIGLLDAPTEGTYFLDGVPVGQLDLRERARLRNREMGFVFQNFNLIRDLNVIENIELPLTFRDLGADERKEQAFAALERVGLLHRAHHLPAQLSGGEQQRVAIARAVAGRPRLVLADEPTGNLDSRTGDAIIELLRELHAGGATICMVTHEPDYAATADRSICLFDGRIDPTSIPVAAVVNA